VNAPLPVFEFRSFRAKHAILGLIVALTLGAMALAQDNSTTDQRQPAWGTSDSPTAGSVQFETSLPPLNAPTTFTNSQFGSGGVGLRNRGTGSISISGVVAPVKAAHIYWAVITTGSAGAADKTIKLQRLSPTPASSLISVSGTLLGTGPSPCWPGNTISVFRGTVPTSVATGNGLYQVTLLPGAGGLTNGADPWAGSVLPLMEGASLVIVGTGSAGQRVVIYDTGLAAHTFAGNPGLSYSLTLPAPTTGSLTLFDSIGADGQEGASRLAKAGLGDEKTIINGVNFAGPSSNAVNGDWNGSSAMPLPQLWDDTGHDITAATPKGTTVLNVEILNQGESSYDCMTTVANVVLEE
jgi:hypothetical protein